LTLSGELVHQIVADRTGRVVQELKQMLKAMGEKVSGTKHDLYDRVTRALSKVGFWGEQESEEQAEEEEEVPRKTKKAKR